MMLPHVIQLTLPNWASPDTKIRYDTYISYMHMIFREVGHTNFVIAGGAIRDLFLGKEPKDIDVFLLNAPCPSDAFNDLPPGHVEASFDGVFAVREYDNRTFQFIHSPYDNINDLLGSFDWIECMYAMDMDGQLWTRNQWWLYPNTTRLLHLNPDRTKINNPVKTLFRAVRFNDRLRLVPSRDDLRDLCQLIIKEQTSGY